MALSVSDNGIMGGRLDLAIAQAEAERRSQDHANEVSARQRQAIDEQFPSLWSGLRSAIKAACESRSEHLRFLVSPNTEAVVERTDNREHAMLRLMQRPHSGLIAFTCKEASGYCTIKLDEQNIARICDQYGIPFPAVEDAAEELLSLLF
jgi:hypothetical protein